MKLTILNSLTSAIMAMLVVNSISQVALAATSDSYDNRTPFPKEMLEKPAFVKEQEREARRDKSHDYRLKIGNDTSIGVVGEGVSIRKVFLLKTEF